MKNIIREYFFSDICEYCDAHEIPKRKTEAFETRDEALEMLKKRLSTNDFELFEEYIEACDVINSEDAYYAFICGIRAAIQVLAEAFAAGSIVR